MSCPGENTLLDYVQGRLTTIDDVDEHLDRCPDCRDAVALLLERPRRQATLRPGDRAGRLVIADVLGRGGMGVVYEAYDLELGRKVAVKVLRVGAKEHATRLAREAQAIARVSHPNVVAVYEIGKLDDDALFVAMELVRGVTLRQWLPREPKAVLDVMLAAGRGLAAAHRAGVVHRDFKPDNVMIADDGSTKVLDFGLALVGPWISTVVADREGNGFDLRLTATGAVIGTPAYMAPEQHEGRVDERSDQFAFCVALHEGLFGRRPFEGLSIAALEATKQREPIVPHRPGVSRAVRSAIARGLSPDPDARFPSMAALIAALEARASGSTSVLALAATAVVVSFGGWALLRAPAVPPTAEVMLPRAMLSADEQAAALQLERGMTRMSRSQPDDAYADFERSFELARSVGADEIAAKAALMAAQVSAFEGARPVTAEQWLRHAEPLIERAGATLQLRRLHEVTLAKLARARGDAVTTEQHARRALAFAEELGDPVLVSAATGELANAVKTVGRVDEARALFERVLALQREKLGVDHPQTAVTLINLGECLLEQGDLAGAKARTEEALRVIGPTAVNAGYAHLQLGEIAIVEGDHAAARVSIAQALAIFEDVYGEDHVFVANALYDLALTHLAAGTPDDAEPLLWRGVSVLQSLQGEGLPQLAYFYTALAELARHRGQHERTLELRAQAVAVAAEHPNGELVRHVQLGRVRDLLDLARLDEAESTLASLPSSESDGQLAFARGRLALARNHVDEAVALLDRAVALLDADKSSTAGERAELHRIHAEALARRRREQSMSHSSKAGVPITRESRHGLETDDS
jgi:tetratricopeptide (TPR) repeat protein/predicted Ser/Thr protein kinase